MVEVEELLGGLVRAAATTVNLAVQVALGTFFAALQYVLGGFKRRGRVRPGGAMLVFTHPMSM